MTSCVTKTDKVWLSKLAPHLGSRRAQGEEELLRPRGATKKEEGCARVEARSVAVASLVEPASPRKSPRSTAAVALRVVVTARADVEKV